MTSFFKQAAKAARPQFNRSTNILMKITGYNDCDAKDVARNSVVGIDLLTKDKVEVFMAKNEKADTAKNPRRTIFEMKGGSDNQRISIGATIIFTGVTELGKTGDVRRLRAYWSEGAIRKFKRVDNNPDNPVEKDANGENKLDGFVFPGVLVRVNAPRPSRTNPDKQTQRVQLLMASNATLIQRLDPDTTVDANNPTQKMTSLRTCLLEILKNTNLGRPSVVLRLVQGDEMVVRTVSLQRDQSAEDAVKNFIEQDEFGSMIAKALSTPGAMGEAFVEAIPQLTSYFATDAVAQEVARIDKAKEIAERQKANPNATPVTPPQTRFHPYSYAEEVPDRNGPEGSTRRIISQGFTVSHLALAPTKDRQGFVVANALPVANDQEVMKINEVLTAHVKTPCRIASSAEDEAGPDEGPLDGAEALTSDAEHPAPASN